MGTCIAFLTLKYNGHGSPPLFGTIVGAVVVGASFGLGDFDVVAAEPAADGAELRRFLQRKLPHYLVPSAIVELRELPRTSHGKVSYRALPPPDGDPMRGYGPFLDDKPGPERSLYWWHYNTSKLGVTLDLFNPRDGPGAHRREPHPSG